MLAAPRCVPPKKLAQKGREAACGCLSQTRLSEHFLPAIPNQALGAWQTLMSSYMVVRAVSQEVRRILVTAFRNDPVFDDIVPSEQSIVFANPTETARDASNRLSLWLYQITENEFLKNQPGPRGKGTELDRFPPLALNLFYLITPFGPSGEADHLLLGKTMQVLYDNAMPRLLDTGDGSEEELRIIFCRLTLEELTRVWEALREPYRLSICYQVRVARIDSERAFATARVAERDNGYRGGSATPGE